MDHHQFDDLARIAAGEADTRRSVVRLLVGGVLGIVGARFGTTETGAVQRH